MEFFLRLIGCEYGHDHSVQAAMWGLTPLSGIAPMRSGACQEQPLCVPPAQLISGTLGVKPATGHVGSGLLQMGSSRDQDQPVPMNGQAYLVGAISNPHLVVACAGSGSMWERLHWELKPAGTSSGLGLLSKRVPLGLLLPVSCPECSATERASGGTQVVPLGQGLR